MQNIRISLDLMKVTGARLVRMNNAANVPENYVAVPVSACFVPSDTPRPYLMATMIHCPNAKYGDFMIKPYLSAEDYNHLTQEERMAQPTVGKGTFMQAASNKQITKQAEVVEAADVQLGGEAEKNEPAATLGVAPSPAGGGPSVPSVEPTWFFVMQGKQALVQVASWNEAVAFADQDVVNRNVIESWQGNNLRGRWKYHAEDFSWVQVLR